MSENPWASHYPDYVDWSAPIKGFPIGDIIDNTAKKFPQHIAMNFLGNTYTYAEVEQQVKHAAAGLQKMGLKKGDRLGLMFPNCPYYPFLYYAALKLGLVVVNFNPLYATHEMQALIDMVRVKVIATVNLKLIYPNLEDRLNDTCLEKIILCPFPDALAFPKKQLFKLLKGKDLAKPTKPEAIIDWNDLVANDGSYTPAQIDPDKDQALIQFTGGTTGIPKGAMLSHANITINCQQINNWFRDSAEGEGKHVVVLPFFHVFAMTCCLNFPFFMGHTVVMLPNFELETTLKVLHKEKPDYFAGVPTLFNAFNNHGGVGSKYDVSSLAYVLSGGAPLPLQVREQFEKVAGGATMIEGYGLSETSPVASTGLPHGENRTGSIGLPMQGTKIEILAHEEIKDDDGNVLHKVGDVLPWGKGYKGEICISGPQVMMGYWERPDATAESIKDGRFHSGDIGHQDADGYAYITDRLKEMIIASGLNIYPRNVEEAIYKNEKVAECAVYGVPDDHRGETVKASIVLQEGASLSADELKAFLADKLASYEQPKVIEFIDELPKSQVGKILKRVLYEEHMARLEGKAA